MFSGFPSNLQISLYLFDKLISFFKVDNHRKWNFSLFSLNLSTINLNSVYSTHEVGLNVLSLVGGCSGFYLECRFKWACQSDNALTIWFGNIEKRRTVMERQLKTLKKLEKYLLINNIYSYFLTLAKGFYLYHIGILCIH